MILTTYKFGLRLYNICKCNGQEYLKYMQTVKMGASRGVNGGWVQYD